MTRVILSIFVFVILLLGCQNKNKVNDGNFILKNYEAEYNYSQTSDNINTAVFNDVILPKTKTIMNAENDKRNFRLKIRLFINENGKADYIKFIEKPKFVDEKLNGKIEELIEYLKNYDFSKVMFKKKKTAFDITISKNGDFNENEFAEAVEEMPSPIGGVRSILEKIKYPEKAKKSGVEGRVFVKAYIDKQGNVVHTELLKGIGYGCDEAAISAIETTKFVPGKQKGKPAKCVVVIPVLFKLQ